MVTPDRIVKDGRKLFFKVSYLLLQTAYLRVYAKLS